MAGRFDALAGCETVFVGQVHSGEIFNQYPQECWLEGTRRWLPGVDRRDVYLTNAVTEVTLGEGAELDHARIQMEGGGGYHVASLWAAQGKASRLRSHVFSLGALASTVKFTGAYS